jgi:hypothetical protein
MTKDEIIRATIWAMRERHGLPATGKTGDDDWDNYEANVIATLTERLPDRDIETCADFGELDVECCHTCHTCYPHYDMYNEDLSDGKKAWICCFVRSALRDEKSPAQEDPEELIDLEVALGGGIRKVEQAIQGNDEEEN